MRRRLMIYLISLMTILLAVVFGFLSLTGLLQNVEEKAKTLLKAHMSEYRAKVIEHVDSVAARSIKFSQALSGLIGAELTANGLTFTALNDNPQAITDIENAVYGLSEQALFQTNASGVFFILDVTANTRVQNAEKNRSGLHIRIGSVNNPNPINPILYLFRGSSGTTRKHGIIHHNHWNLEFSTDDFTFYERLKQDSGRELVKNWYFSPVLDFRMTWDDAAFIAAPVYGADGEFYGVCGFEISRMYYLHSHMLSASELGNVAGLLSLRERDELRTDIGLESGTYGGYSASLTKKALTAEPRGALMSYSDGQDRFIGLEQAVTLSPLDGADMWIISVMIPESEYNIMSRNQNFLIALLLALVFTISVLASLLLSIRYVQPITEGLEIIKKKGPGRSKVPEINELLDFLAEQDAERERASQTLEANSTLVASYNSFMSRLKTLTAAEREIFDLYLRGLSAQQIAEKRSSSLSTIKFHNRNIYTKLGIGSRDELMLIAGMMLGKGNRSGDALPNSTN